MEPTVRRHVTHMRRVELELVLDSPTLSHGFHGAVSADTDGKEPVAPRRGLPGLRGQTVAIDHDRKPVTLETLEPLLGPLPQVRAPVRHLDNHDNRPIAVRPGVSHSPCRIPELFLRCDDDERRAGDLR